jgi:hypothetical protein
MRIDVTGTVVTKEMYDHGVPNGRWWLQDVFYLYCVAWDPCLLCRSKEPPTYREPGDPIDRPGESLLLFAQPTLPADASVIDEVLSGGGNVVLNHPSRELLEAVDAGFTGDGYGRTIISLRERWHMDPPTDGPYIYPHMQEFLRLNPAAGKVFSRIGGNPDLIAAKNAAVFAGDPIAALTQYQYMPWKQGPLLGELAGLLARVAAHFSGESISREEQRKMLKQFELRRDFHSFGYAVLTLRELARCYGDEEIDLSETTGLAMDAARVLVEGTPRDAAAGLRSAFASLEGVNRKYQPMPAIFTDTLHGGELYPDIGYFEIDWPEHPAEMLRTYMEWSAKRSYRFNVDLGATTVRELALRFPDLFEELRTAQKRGRLEFVNGSCNQPYPPFHSLESQIRQFDVGREVWQEVFGCPPWTYASQEFGFCPQMATVLKQEGFRNAVVRVQNMGDAPTLTDELIEWEAPNGDRLRSLPSHPHKSEQQNQFTYNNLHMKLWMHQQDNLDFAVFTCLGDITFHRPMREELARVCHYAPVFGRFETMQGYFKKTRKVEAPRARLYMREFDCDCGFINLAIWPIYKEYTGNYNTNCMNSLACTDLFSAAEMLDAVAALDEGRETVDDVHADNWEALTHYQGHGTYIVPYYASGGFQGPGDNPRNREIRRAELNVNEYLGPVDHRPVVEVTTKWMDESIEKAHGVVRNALAPATGEYDSGFAFFNASPARTGLVRIPGGVGKSYESGGVAVPTQDDGSDCLAMTPLPAHGVAVLSETGADAQLPADRVRAVQDVLENDTLLAEFDPGTGCLTALIRKGDGRSLLREGSHAFYSPGSGTQRCTASRVRASGPLRGAIEFDIEFSRGDEIVCRLTTCASLDSGGTVLDFETIVHDAPHVEDNQWENHLGVAFEPADPEFNVHACHFNVMEEVPDKTLSSTNVLVAQSEWAAIAFLNAGNQFYVREDGRLANILIMENEPARRFRYAVGTAAENPLMQGKMWRQPNDATRAGTGGLAGSLFEFGSPDIELLSCRKDGNSLRLRMANTTPDRIRTTLRAWLPVKEATRTLLNGDPKGSLKVESGEVKLTFRSWDILQAKIVL